MFALKLPPHLRRICLWIPTLFPIRLLVVGGYREAAAAIRGEDVYGALKFENGVHRVRERETNRQRETERTRAIRLFVNATSTHMFGS